MVTRRARARWLVGAAAIAVAVAIGLGTGAFGSGASAAAGKQAPARASAVVGHKVHPAASLKKEVLKATYVESGASGVSLPASTFVAIDPLGKITCPAPSGSTCTITDTVSMQQGGGANEADNYMAAPWQIDGSYVGEGGPFFDSAPADGAFAGGTWTDAQYGVTPGKHKVQTFAYSFDGASLEYWTITYNVYVP